MNTSIFSTAPGAGGQRWGLSPRKPPHFHVASRPYSFGVSGEPRGRSEGLDLYYDQKRNTLDEHVSKSSRCYASAFHAGPPRIQYHKPVSDLGPGSYTLSDDST